MERSFSSSIRGFLFLDSSCLKSLSLTFALVSCPLPSDDEVHSFSYRRKSSIYLFRVSLPPFPLRCVVPFPYVILSSPPNFGSFPWSILEVLLLSYFFFSVHSCFIFFSRLLRQISFEAIPPLFPSPRVLIFRQFCFGTLLFILPSPLFLGQADQNLHDHFFLASSASIRPTPFSCDPRLAPPFPSPFLRKRCTP